MKTKAKAYAYVVRRGHLLVFRHAEFPEVGIQVPGGTIDAGETPEHAVLRETHEETGLEGLSIVRALGEHVRDMRDFDEQAFHHRYFFELACGDAPETWQWWERTPSGGGPPIAFDFFWVPIDAVPTLFAEHDYFVTALRP
jgi:8-oxo-dGTP diphosphatase